MFTDMTAPCVRCYCYVDHVDLATIADGVVEAPTGMALKATGKGQQDGEEGRKLKLKLMVMVMVMVMLTLMLMGIGMGENRGNPVRHLGEAKCEKWKAMGWMNHSA